jgi:hypothetical protein
VFVQWRNITRKDDEKCLDKLKMVKIEGKFPMTRLIVKIITVLKLRLSKFHDLVIDNQKYWCYN